MNPKLKEHKRAAKIRWGVATPYRVGLLSGEAGEQMESPYPSGTSADANFKAGVKCGAYLRSGGRP